MKSTLLSSNIVFLEISNGHHTLLWYSSSTIDCCNSFVISHLLTENFVHVGVLTSADQDLVLAQL